MTYRTQMLLIITERSEINPTESRLELAGTLAMVESRTPDVHPVALRESSAKALLEIEQLVNSQLPHLRLHIFVEEMEDTL